VFPVPTTNAVGGTEGAKHRKRLGILTRRPAAISPDWLFVASPSHGSRSLRPQRPTYASLLSYASDVGAQVRSPTRNRVRHTFAPTLYQKQPGLLRRPASELLMSERTIPISDRRSKHRGETGRHAWVRVTAGLAGGYHPMPATTSNKAVCFQRTGRALAPTL
jgi:hypothetical protein